MAMTYKELRAAADKAWAPLAKPERTLIKVGVATCSRVVGAEETLKAIRDAVSSGKLAADVMLTGCNGLCYAEPLVEVVAPGKPGVLYQQLTADKEPSLLDAIASGATAGPGALSVMGDSAAGDVPPIGSLPFWRGQTRRLKKDLVHAQRRAETRAHDLEGVSAD